MAISDKVLALAVKTVLEFEDRDPKTLTKSQLNTLTAALIIIEEAEKEK